MVENERISGHLPSRGRRPLEVRSITGCQRDRDRDQDRDREIRDEDAIVTRRKGRGYRISGDKGSGNDPGPGFAATTATATAVGSDSGKWFAGYAAGLQGNGPGLAQGQGQRQVSDVLPAGGSGGGGVGGNGGAGTISATRRRSEESGMASEDTSG